MKLPVPNLTPAQGNGSGSQPPESRPGLGTFGGVYTPSVLTILGVIMYLRFGWVVGNVGLLGTLVIVTLSTSITFLTSLSVCAIATDRVVRVGGAYYMISRSLGIETGGAVGIPLFFAQALSVALYTIGFAESLTLAFDNLNRGLVAFITTLLVAVVAFTSANAAIKTQYFIMAAIVLSLVCLLLGQPLDPTEVATPALTEPESFWQVFAVFFPAVTGIMAGVNLSGDLKDPTKSLPIGTLAAVGTGFVIYLIVPVILAGRVDAQTLIAEPLIMQRISLWGPAILLGVWGATLSSAIGSILGAPRVLQALARDGVLPRWMRVLGSGSGPNDEPRIGTIVTLGVALGAVSIGDLNFIAPVLTMFFLTTYLVLNIAAGLESFVQSPSFRPTFPVAWWLSLLGAAGCIVVMFLINALATVVAAVVVLVIFFWLQQRSLIATWGDVRTGLRLALLREGIFQLDPTSDADPRNWRPHVLALTGAPQRRWGLVEFADGLVNNRGLITIASILPSGSRDGVQKNSMESTIRDYLDKRGVQALVRVIAAADPFNGARQLVETYGLGPLIPNMVVMGASGDGERLSSYCHLVRDIHLAGRSIAILKDNPNSGFGRRRRIDVWWRGLQGNGALMLLLADLLRNNLQWRNATIAIKLAVPDANAAQAAQTNIARLIDDLRLKRTETVVIESRERPFGTILAEASRQTDLIFLGMARPGDSDTENNNTFVEHYQTLEQLSQDLPTTVYVLAAPNIGFATILASQ
ncbi:MAG: amino acid permease [Cyanobacteria bacterium P01_A01_bin.3]